MKIIDRPEVDRALDFPRLIQAIDRGFARQYVMPQRQVFALSPAADSHNGFAVLPAWNDSLIGVKVFTHFPGNAAHGLASLASKVLLFEREHGQPLALVDGTSLTYWRTAAVSALASRYLSRADAGTLLLLGTGNLAVPLVDAHLCVRDIHTVLVWGRDAIKAAALASVLRQRHPRCDVVCISSVEQGAARADIIVSATGAATPLLLGEWVAEGCHVDLLGNHQRDGRECDSALVAASALFVDSRQNVLAEAGELLIPIAEGLITPDHVRGELADLCTGRVAGRTNSAERTLFKSVGTALADLLAAELVLQAS